MASISGPHISIAAGIVIAIVASFVQSLGLTVQRKSHVLNQLMPENQRRKEYRRPLWLLGFAIFISSNVLGSLFQIAALPIVVLAPLGAVSLLWNALFARILLGDVFSKWMVLGTILIAGGAVLVAIFGIVPEPTHSIEDLLVLFSRPTFIVYFSLLGFVLAVCLVVTHIVEWTYARRLPSQPPSPALDAMLLPPAANPIITTAHIMSEQTPLLDRKPPSSRASSISLRSLANRVTLPSSRVPLFLAISYASASGILSGMCLLFAKSGVELLLLTIGGQNQFWRWQTWLLLVGLGAFALLQLWYLHKALILADPTVVCPLAFCFYNLSSIVNGLVYFDQFSLIPWLHLFLVGVGIVVLLGGVWVVSINNGGGGIDIGTWREGEGEEGSDSDSDEDVEAGYSRRTLSLSPRQSMDGLQLGPVPMERPSVSESHADRNTGPRFPGSSRSDSSIPTHERRLSESTVRPGARREQDLRTTMHRRRPTLDTSTRSPPMSPPLTATGTLVGTGFSIGLSPVSPGFVLVPKERRRRVSGMTTDSHERSPLMARSVSESDVPAAPPAASEPLVDLESEREQPGPPANEQSRWRRVFSWGSK